MIINSQVPTQIDLVKLLKSVVFQPLSVSASSFQAAYITLSDLKVKIIFSTFSFIYERLKNVMLTCLQQQTGSEIKARSIERALIQIQAWRCPTLTWGDPTLPSALLRFTTEFGMGSGGSITLWSPSKFCFIYHLMAINSNLGKI